MRNTSPAATTTESIMVPQHGRATGLEALGRGMILLGVLSSTWTSLLVAGQMVSDIFLYGGAALAFAARPRPLLAKPRTGRSLKPMAVAAWAILGGGVFVASKAASPAAELGVTISILLSLIGLPIVVLVYCRNAADAVRLVEMLLVSLAVNGLLCLATYVSGVAVTPMQSQWNASRPFSATRLVGLTGHPNMLGYAAAATLPMVPMLWRVLRLRHSLLVLSTLCALAAASALLSGSRGGALGVVAGCAVGGIMGGTRYRMRWLFSLVPVAVVFMVALPNSPLAVRLLGSTDAAASDEQRRESLGAAIGQLSEHFPSGTGLRTLATVHSGLVALLLGAGALMTTGVIIWAVYTASNLRQLRRSEDRVMRDLGRACTASAIGSLSYLATSPFMYHRHALLAAALAIALAQRTPAEGPAAIGAGGVPALDQLDKADTEVSARTTTEGSEFV